MKKDTGIAIGLLILFAIVLSTFFIGVLTQIAFFVEMSLLSVVEIGYIFGGITFMLICIVVGAADKKE